MAAAISFRHRRPGEKAIHVGGRSGRVERAVRVVLEASDGRVLVTSIQRQSDGTLIGEVYGVMPNQRSVAVGDHVQFNESQIFRFRTADELSDDEKVVDDIAAMASTFEQRFRELSGEPQKPPEVSREAADLFAEAKAWNADQPVEARAPEIPDAAPATPRPAAAPRVEAAPSPAARVVPAPAAPPPRPAAPAPAAPVQAVPEPAPPKEPPAMPAPSRPEPEVTPEPPPAPAPAATTETFKCIECGTRLTIPPPAEGGTDEPIKIGCPTCGRINRPPERRL